ncbi:hypothetical protein GpartN1_g761.t1 [Galdieria partita]|uniref:BZIP domain-containing protein n=1 Tax=Galdieria partita TaxID=83374 RepID=A0A9C7PR59_9RHOD|nr:hypothetical protein GpartN1_g761.t1 [Galdieria partita]
MSYLPKRKQSETEEAGSSQEQAHVVDRSFAPRLPPLRTLFEGTAALPRIKQSLTESEGENLPSYSSRRPSIPLITQSPSSQAAPGTERSPYHQLKFTADEPYTEVSHLVSACSNTRQFPLLSGPGVSSLEKRSSSLSTIEEERETIRSRTTKKRSYPLPILYEQQSETKSRREQSYATSLLKESEEREPEIAHAHHSQTRVPIFQTTQTEVSSESKSAFKPVVLSSKLLGRYEEEEEEEEEAQSGPSSTNVSSSQVLELLQSKGKKNLSEEERKTLKILRNRLSAEKSRLRQRQRMAEMARQIQEYEEALNAIRSEANALLRYVERLEAFCRLTGIPDYELQRPTLKFLPP